MSYEQALIHENALVDHYQRQVDRTDYRTIRLERTIREAQAELAKVEEERLAAPERLKAAKANVVKLKNKIAMEERAQDPKVKEVRRLARRLAKELGCKPSEVADKIKELQDASPKS